MKQLWLTFLQIKHHLNVSWHPCPKLQSWNSLAQRCWASSGDISILELGKWPNRMTTIFLRYTCTIIRMRSPEEKSSTSIWTNFDTAWKLFPKCFQIKQLRSSLCRTGHQTTSESQNLILNPRAFWWERFFWTWKQHHHRISHQHMHQKPSPKTYADAKKEKNNVPEV